MARSEQKSISWRQGIVGRFSKAIELVVGRFCGTFETMKVCLELLRHCQFVGRKIDSE